MNSTSSNDSLNASLGGALGASLGTSHNGSLNASLGTSHNGSLNGSLNGSFDAENREMHNAYSLIARTNQSFFLTGRAGTGKTTFLKNIQESVDKNFVVLAPSGVAAIHAGGQTIHSFFGLDLGVQGPRSCGTMNHNKISIVQNVDTIIIDEVSMVRCDILDAVERTLREYRHSSRPFGGVQMVLVGDIFQLPPVVKKEDKEVLRSIYGTDCPFFYKANCLAGLNLPKIEFRKIYRQSDLHFIELLDRFRLGAVRQSDLDELNARVGAAKDDADEMRITLTAFKRDAEAINETRLREIDKPAYSYIAAFEGSSDKLRDVVDECLLLKEGAQVMFLRNDSAGRWANGTIGKVSAIGDSLVKVTLEDGSEEEVGKETWEAYEYSYDAAEKVCRKTVVGRVTQYPLRLAWAITIHKSQSLTFDKVAVDFGRGAFTCGQAYVALSRCRSLEGLRLLRRIDFNSIRVSGDALRFAASYNDEKVISTELTIGEAVNEYERSGDFDGAACRLFAMCDEEAHNGNVFYAFELLNRALSYVADDACLFGQDWKPVDNGCKESMLLNAAGLLYSGKTDEALALLGSVVSASDRNFNGLYLMGRALEAKEDWETVETFYNQMVAVFNDTVENGLDSASFRKFKYRLAVLNESHYGDPGVEILVSLIAENPRYDKYHSDLRWMLRNHRDKVRIASGEENFLLRDLMDESVPDEDFLGKLRQERDRKSEAWTAYKSFLSRLKL